MDADGAVPLHTGSLTRTQDLLIGGDWVGGAERFEVRDRYDDTLFAEVASASEEQVGAAVMAAREAFEADTLTPYDRFEILSRAAGMVADRREGFVQSIVAETGFTVGDADGEVDRCVQTLLLSAEEAKRITGEMIPIEAAPGQRRRMAYTMRVPRGVVCAITPFNSPLNTVAHKIAPALASGHAVVLKPASHTPVTAAQLCQTFMEAGLPGGYLNLVFGSGRTVGNWLALDPGVDFFTFTGSTGVGRELRRQAGLRPTSLELGSISSTLICEDADLTDAVNKCVRAGFRKAGQVCTSVQRIYVQEGVYERFEHAFVEATSALKVGDPRDPETDVGPMITVKEAERVERWIQEAVDGGARPLLRGSREAAVLRPTILEGVDESAQIVCEEAFGPVVVLNRSASVEEAFDSMNDTPYGLAAGVFTRDVGRAIEATRRLHMGGVHINQTSSSRVDLMPYGGAKESGPGWEGPRYAIEEMMEKRLVTITW